MRALWFAVFVPPVLAFGPWNLALTGSTAGLRGIHNAGVGVIWASGTRGTVLRSEDAGYMWQICKMPSDTVQLDFRAVFAWSANHAQVMSSGPGAQSRLYETTDGGATWRLLFQNPDAQGFWDALTYRDQSGYLLGDPVDGHFVLYRSSDSGRHWNRDDSRTLAAAPQGEGVFAASNSSLLVLADGDVLFGTGGVGGPRVFRCTASKGWNPVKVPLAGGADSAGVFSLALRDNLHGIAVGGDYRKPQQTAGTAAWTSDGGATWHAAEVFPGGYRSAVKWNEQPPEWIAVGPNGSDVSRDDGRTWIHLDSANWNALSLPWVAGPQGRIASLNAPASRTKLPNARSKH
jgi:photosystem II stability/assembly factor-like uncharacterized protein